MAAINAGDVEAGLEALQGRYGRRIEQFVMGIVQDSHLAQDVTQETFMKVFLKSDFYEIGTNFRAWLYEIARNQALSALRSRKRNPRPVTSLMSSDEEAEGDMLEQIVDGGIQRNLEEDEFMAAFADAVACLPERYRQVFTSCVIQGKSYQEVAKSLKLPTGTVAIRIMRARKRLFQALSHHLDRLRRPPACIQ